MKNYLNDSIANAGTVVHDVQNVHDLSINTIKKKSLNIQQSYIPAFT